MKFKKRDDLPSSNKNMDSLAYEILHEVMLYLPNAVDIIFLGRANKKLNKYVTQNEYYISNQLCKKYIGYKYYDEADHQSYRSYMNNIYSKRIYIISNNIINRYNLLRERNITRNWYGLDSNIFTGYDEIKSVMSSIKKNFNYKLYKKMCSVMCEMFTIEDLVNEYVHYNNNSIVLVILPNDINQMMIVRNSFTDVTYKTELSLSNSRHFTLQFDYAMYAKKSPVIFTLDNYTQYLKVKNEIVHSKTRYNMNMYQKVLIIHCDENWKHDKEVKKKTKARVEWDSLLSSLQDNFHVDRIFYQFKQELI